MFDSCPQFAHHSHQQLRLLPSVGQLKTIAPSHRILLRPELAEECERCIRRRTSTPASKAIRPPAHEQFEPVALMLEAYLYLYLLSAGYAAMETPAVVNDAMHQTVVLIGDRPGELAPDDVVRQVAGQSQVRKARRSKPRA